jgi:hypothetical protein
METMISNDRTNNTIFIPDNFNHFLIGFHGEPQVNQIQVERVLLESEQHIWNFTVPVIYSAFIDENKRVSLNGELFFQLLPFFEESPDFYNPRMRVSFYSLTVDGKTFQNGHLVGDDGYIANEHISGWFNRESVDDSFIGGEWLEKSLNAVVEIRNDNRIIWTYSDGMEEISHWDFFSSNVIQTCYVDPDNRVVFTICDEWFIELNRNRITFTLLDDHDTTFILSK